MEINKEREDFEAEFSKIKSDIAFWLHTWDEEMQGYNHPVMCWFWYMWQAAKATPEGFVLISKKLSDELNDHLWDFMTDNFISTNEDGDSYIACDDFDLGKFYSEIIEAQEQSHD